MIECDYNTVPTTEEKDALKAQSDKSYSDFVEARKVVFAWIEDNTIKSLEELEEVPVLLEPIRGCYSKLQLDYIVVKSTEDPPRYALISTEAEYVGDEEAESSISIESRKTTTCNQFLKYCIFPEDIQSCYRAASTIYDKAHTQYQAFTRKERDYKEYLKLKNRFYGEVDS